MFVPSTVELENNRLPRGLICMRVMLLLVCSTRNITQFERIPVRITQRTLSTSRKHFGNLRPILVNKAAPSPPRLIPSFLVLNARSIVKPDAIPALCADIKCNNVDVCCISETWLKPTIDGFHVTSQYIRRPYRCTKFPAKTRCVSRYTKITLILTLFCELE